MTESVSTQKPALDRLLEDLVRDGWLMGMNAGLDPAMARMDPATGVFCAQHFESLVSVAVGDVGRGRTRVGDGPATGNVAVLSVRITEWSHDSEEDALNASARALETVLRPDDVLGRTGASTFSLLLRGCPMDTLEIIAHRCVKVLKESGVRGSSCAVAAHGHTAAELIQASCGGFRSYSGPV